MSTFVLVHGTWQSSATWDLLAPLLEKHGHRVTLPVLSGLGMDQSRLSPNITLEQHVKDVSRELSALPHQVILVGHSYAGMIISGVVEMNPTQVLRLVFLDAFIPEDGQSALDLLPPEIGGYFRKVARENGDGWRLPGGEGQLDLWGLKSGEARDFVRARLCDFSLRCFEEPLRLPVNQKAAFQQPSLVALRKDIRRGRSSSRLPERLVPQAGRSPNCRQATTATSNVRARLPTFCYRTRSRNEV